MLSIGKITAGPAAAAYYLDQVARGREDYYAGEGEEAGRWVGAGVPLLHWDGEVSGDDFVSLLGGAGLRKPRVNGVSGFDLTFSAPKSVSVLWAVAPAAIAAELRAAHDAAVTEALAYMESEACRGRRGTDGVVQVHGRGIVGAAFMHRSSRAGDPQLHTHVVVGNLTQGPDGRWTALDGRHLYRQATTGGYLYQAALRREITERLGLQWEPVERGVADIRGVPRGVVEHFSRRRSQIVEHMADRGVHSRASARVAALETRRAKTDVPIDRLRADWQARAEEHGLSPDMIARLPGRTRVRELELPPDLLREITEQGSTFGRADLLQALAAAQPTGARVADLEALATAQLTDAEVVRLREGVAAAGVTEPRYTTRELLETEAALIEGALARRDVSAVHVSDDVLGRLVADHPTLSEEQRNVVRNLCSRRHGVAVVRAAAGTGKTFVLDAAREAWQAEDIPVVGCALSARAALELEDQSAIPAVTIAAVRARLTDGDELPHGGVLVVDEAGMVGTRALAELARAAEEAEAKLVLVGDDRQLPEIEAGGSFKALADRLGASELTEVRRQREQWDCDALDALRSGEVERWACAYREHGRITVAESAADTRDALVNDWSRADGDKLMIAARRSDVRDLNERARPLLRDQGKLGPDVLEAAGRGYAPGDRVIGARNDRSRGILNGQRGTVTKVDRDRQVVSVRLDGGHEIDLDGAYLRDGHLEHGYAITAHRAQGATVDRSFVLGSENLYREWGYTALSRHRDEARFYVNRGDFETDRDLAPDPDPVARQIERLLEQSRAKELALDQVEARDERASDRTPGRAETRDEPVRVEPEVLEADHARLRERLTREPLPSRDLDVRAEEAERAWKTLEATRERIAGLEEQRAETSIFRFQDRAVLKDQMDINKDIEARQRDRWEKAAGEHREAASRTGTWLQRHGEVAARFLAVADTTTAVSSRA